MNIHAVSETQTIPPATDQRFLSNDLLFEMERRGILTSNAHRLYHLIKTSMSSSPQTMLSKWVYDRHAMKRLNIFHEDLRAAQSALHRTGLIEIQPGEVQTKYELLLPNPAEYLNMVPTSHHTTNCRRNLFRYKRSRELLDDWQRTVLSDNAQSVYAILWNQLSKDNLTAGRVTNLKLGTVSRLNPVQINAALTELVRMKLISYTTDVTSIHCSLTEPTKEITH